MNAERWQQIELILDAVLDSPEPERAQRLTDLCKGDVSLHSEVAQLLSQMHRENDALEKTLGEGFATLLDTVGELEVTRFIGQRVGTYRLREVIGRGGMGVVYRGERDDGAYQQQVAIKFIPTGLDSDLLRQRFIKERQMLASLQHTHIAQLFDGGVTDESTPYLVMELIDGISIDQYCDQHQLPIDARLDLFRSVCAAVQYAHQQLIIHRDIKSDNVLVTKNGTVKLLDFGIARLLDEAREPNAATTTVMAITPAFASPEHLQGERVGVASDVYSLGVLLYKLLCGQLPFTASGRSTADQLLQRQTTLPVPPSRIVAEQTTQNTLTAKTSARQLSGELDSIVLKALRAEPQSRYATVQALVSDLDCYATQRPVSALFGRRRYRFKKYLTRNRWPILVTGAVIGSLSIGLVLAVLNAHRAVQEAAQNRHMASFFQRVFDTANPNITNTTPPSVRELLFDLERAIRFDDLLSDHSRAELLHGTGYALYALNDFERARTLLNDALLLRQNTLTSPDWSLADSHSSLGLAWYALNDFTQAELHLNEARQQLIALGHDQSSAMVTVLTYLGHIEAAKGDVDAALALRRDVVQRVEDTDSPNRQSMGTAFANLAGQLGNDASQYEQAAALFEKALPLLSTSLGASHPTTRATRNNFALLRHRQGNFTEAESLYRETLSDAQRFSGEGSLSLAAPLNNLGNLLTDAGRFDDAYEMLLQAADVTRRTLPIQSVTRVATDINLAQVLLYLNKPDEALQHLKPLTSIKLPNSTINRQVEARVLTLQGEGALLQDAPEQAYQQLETFLGTIADGERDASWYSALMTTAAEAAAMAEQWTDAVRYADIASRTIAVNTPESSVRIQRVRLVLAFVQLQQATSNAIEISTVDAASLLTIFDEEDYRHRMVQAIVTKNAQTNSK